MRDRMLSSVPVFCPPGASNGPPLVIVKKSVDIATCLQGKKITPAENHCYRVILWHLVGSLIYIY